MPVATANANSAFVTLAAVLAGLAVAAGAFGAHALQGHVDAAALQIWHTAVEYQMWHALALLMIALHAERIRFATSMCGILVVEIALFSGSLYALALGAPRIVGIVTPFGGVAFIAAWGLLTVGLRKRDRVD